MDISTYTLKLDMYVEQEREISQLKRDGKITLAQKQEIFCKMLGSDLCCITKVIFGGPLWDNLSLPYRTSAQEIWEKYASPNLKNKLFVPMIM